MNKALALCCGAVLALASAAAQERFRKGPPVPDPLPPLELPRVESMVLSNGLRVAVAEREGQQFISLELVLPVGEKDSPEGLPGLAGFTAAMISRGGPLLSASQLEDRIEAIGGQLTTTTTIDLTRFSLFFLAPYLNQAMEILGLIILQPEFSDQEIANLRRTQSYELREKQRDAEFLGRRQLLRLLLQGHPCLKSLYSEDALRSFTRKDIQAFYDQHYRPNKAILLLAGSLNLTSAARLATRHLGLWQRKTAPASAIPPPLVNSVERICLVDLPQAKDVVLFVGNVVFGQGDADSLAFSVLNQILGGTPYSRLFMNLRETREYAYYAFSQIELFHDCGVFFVRARVVPEACVTALREITKELDRMAQEKVSTFEVEQAKSYLIGSFPLQINRLDDLARRVSDLLAYSLSEAHWSGYYDAITLVDSDKIFEVAQKYLLPKPVAVVVGSRETLAEYLREIGEFEVYDSKGVLLYPANKGAQE